MAETIANLTGIKPHYVRPPYGDRRAVVTYAARHPDAPIAYWDLGFGDWDRVEVEEVRIRIKRELRDGMIILVHDGASPDSEYKDRSQAIEITRILLDECKAAGLSVRRLPE